MKYILPILLFSITFTAVVPPTKKATKNICFLVDTSGSMDGDKIGKAINAFLILGEVPVDEMNISIISFTTYATKYVFKGSKDKKGSYWAAMPDVDKLKEARQFLARQKVDGGTRLCPGLISAFALAYGKKKKMTIIIISDMQFYYENEQALVGTIKRLQEARKEKVVIGLVGVGVTNKGDTEKATALAKVGKGGYYTIK